jgi:asparagine synthase (glutamine-hydrolysing)
MSVIFGVRNVEGKSVEKQFLLDLSRATDRFTHDGISFRTLGQVGMGFQLFRTHERSDQSHPTLDPRGNMVSLDGRLDNYADLCGLLGFNPHETNDPEIVLAAFERWGEACFSRFIGDWALALWAGSSGALYLARDHAGSRTLYYEREKDCIIWSTSLETFFVGGRGHDLDEGFAACYLACQPIRDLTPYKTIRAVPPAHFVKLHGGETTCHAHWQWMATGTISYRTDQEYEEHFVSLFRRSVERRTGPGAAIIAHLSGGMDSTSIVCMSDLIRRTSGTAPEGLIDTLSFFDESEPSWNERPFFTAVEKSRGRTGIHFETSFMNQSFEPPDSSQGRYLLPGMDSGSAEQARKLDLRLDGGGYRIILSGIGGDELLGGVPTPLPELANLLVRGQVNRLFAQAVEWSLVRRTPIFKILFETFAFSGALYQLLPGARSKMPPWLAPHLCNLCPERGRALGLEKKRLGRSPSAISNGLAWWSILETLPHLHPSIVSRREFRYPFLDRDLVDFLFRVPREQLVRPGRRRSLMRRALKEIVPVEVLERRRKAHLVRGPIAAMQAFQATIESSIANSARSELGWVDPERLRQAVNRAIDGADPKWSMAIMRAISLELWLKSLSPRSIGEPLFPQIELQAFTG